MYANETLKESLSSMSEKEGKSSLESETPPATFLLKMNFRVGAEKMASAIADSVGGRSTEDDKVSELKNVILGGMADSKKGATKGTSFQFDCGNDGIDVSVNGKLSGRVESSGLSKAFCGVYLDDNAVSPTLKSSLLDHCSKE